MTAIAIFDTLAIEIRLKRKFVVNGVRKIGKNLDAPEYKQFEDIKNRRLDGSEFWLACELAIILGYAK